MQTEVLNQLLGSFRELKLSAFDENQLSKTTLPEGGILFLSSNNNSVLAYLKVARLGLDFSKKQLFEDLLASNLLGGEFGNIRIAYDKDTTVVWLCYNILTENLNALAFEEKLKIFISDAQNYRALLLNQVISNILEASSQDSAAASDYIKNNQAIQDENIRPQQVTGEVSGVQSSEESSSADPEDKATVDVVLQQAMFMMA